MANISLQESKANPRTIKQKLESELFRDGLGDWIWLFVDNRLGHCQ